MCVCVLFVLCVFVCGCVVCVRYDYVCLHMCGCECMRALVLNAFHSFRELIGTCFSTMLHLSDADVNSRASRILHVFTNLDHNAKRYSIQFLCIIPSSFASYVHFFLVKIDILGTCSRFRQC